MPDTRSTFMLTDGFERVGQWWIPGAPEVRLHGTLTFSRDRLVLVTPKPFTINRPCDPPDQSDSSRWECIYGQMSDGKLVTLFDSLKVSQSAEKTTYFMTFALIGEHTESLKGIRIRSVKLFCDHLSAFLVHDNCISEKLHNEGESWVGLDLQFRAPDRHIWPIRSIDARVESDVSPQLNTTRNEIRFNFDVFLTFEFESESTFEWCMRAVWHFCHLMTVLTDEPVSPTGILLRLHDGPKCCWLLAASPRWPGKSRDRDPSVLFFYHEHLREKFEQILDTWFSFNDIRRDAVDLAMDAIRDREQSLRSRFLLAAQALEAISRATTSSLYMDATDFNEVARELGEAIPDRIDDDHRASLWNRIRFGNEFSLRKRLTALLETLPEEARDAVCANATRFIGEVVDTRNYYTHYTDELRDKALCDEGVYWATEQLLLLARLLLLAELGIDARESVSRMKSHWRIQQRIAGWKKYSEETTT